MARGTPSVTTEPRRGGQPADEAYLRAVAERVRMARAGRGMTRKTLAHLSGVSERYLADLEQGSGNASLLVLRRIGEALAVSVASLLEAPPETATLDPGLRTVLERLSSVDSEKALRLLTQAFPGPTTDRSKRLALIGLRGAGKSTVGSVVAQRLERPFISLARHIELTVGQSIAAVIAKGGQAAYRKIELDTLRRVIETHPLAVIDAGGGLVTEPAAYHLLRASCLVVWLKADPAVHMQRVVAQGDKRPMADADEPMSDLEAILASRSRLYAMADVTIDTSNLTIAATIEAVQAVVRQ